MKRLKLKTGLMAILAALTFTACDMMTEDLSDCPTGLYVNFVYDYNIQRADMFKDHVGSLQLYVYDEQDRLVAERKVDGSQLALYGFYCHFTEDELAPGHRYHLRALAMQRDMSQTHSHLLPSLTIGSALTDLQVRLRTQPEGARTTSPALSGFPAEPATRAPLMGVPYALPLDTLWHTLCMLQNTDRTMPQATKYREHADGTISSNAIDDIYLEQGVPAYCTVSLIRDTKNLNLSLREIDNPEQVSHEDYDITILDDNVLLDCNNNVVEGQDSLVYRPYAQWTYVVESDGETNADYSAHYDIAFNRLRYNGIGGKNAVLAIRKRDTGEVIVLFNLPYILCQGRMAYEILNYQPQEYLDREYDYRLELFLKNGRWQEGCYLVICVHDLPWSVRMQYVKLQ